MTLDPLREAANDYYQRGWLPIPLGLDGNGKPKRPIDREWQLTPRTPAGIRSLSWRKAAGIGIVLGQASSNLSALDIDDNTLASAVFALLVRSHRFTRMVWTGRGNLHVFFHESTPSRSTALHVPWRGRMVNVELKAGRDGVATQVASPPTPGYTLACDAAPIEVPSIAEAWGSLSRALGIDTLTPDAGATALGGYPKAWLPSVPEGERNRAVFVEACMLREANMPLAEAIAVLKIRVEHAYAQGHATWAEYERTIHSAYSRDPEHATRTPAPGGVDLRRPVRGGRGRLSNRQTRRDSGTPAVRPPHMFVGDL